MVFIVKDIKIEITFLFVAFISFVLSLNAPANVLITVISSLLHELGHLFTMCVIGNKPEKVRFELTGINIIRNQAINTGIKKEVLISLGGPLVNAIVFVICCLVLCFYSSQMLVTVAGINLILMTFNMLPIKRLDGGVTLFYILSQKVEIDMCIKILKITSAFFIALIYIWGIYIFISSRYNFSLIIIAIFLTLSLFSNNEY